MTRYDMETDLLSLQISELTVNSIRQDLCQTPPEIKILPYEQSKKHAKRQAMSSAIGAVGSQAIALPVFSYFLSQIAIHTIEYGADAANIGSLVVFSATAAGAAGITARCVSWCIDSTKKYLHYKREQKQYIEAMRDYTIEEIIDNSPIPNN